MMTFDAFMRQPPVSRDNRNDAGNHPPPSRYTEQVEQEIGYPRPPPPALVVRSSPDPRKRPPGIGLVVGRQDQRQVDEAYDDQKPPGLAQQAHKAGRDGRFRRSRPCRRGGLAAADRRLLVSIYNHCVMMHI